MAAPTFVSETATAYDRTASTSRATASISVNAGDILVATAHGEDDQDPAFTNLTLSVSGGGLSWTSQQNVFAVDYSQVRVWTAVASSTTSFAVTFSRTGAGSYGFGGSVQVWRDSDGVGASAKTNVASGAPTLDLTTTQANSAIVVSVGDWNAVDGASRTWRTNAGALTEEVYYYDGVSGTYYDGYHADAGAVGTYAVGLSAPGGQKYAIIALEVKGTSGPAPSYSVAWITA